MVVLGCVSHGAKFNADEIEKATSTTAVVYFYRPFYFYAPSRLQGKVSDMPVIANGVRIGVLDNGAYFKVVMRPASYEVHSVTGAIDRTSTFSFEAGKVYFVKAFIDVGMWVSSVRFSMVDKKDALPEIIKTSEQP